MREDQSARFYELMVITAPDGTPEELMANVDQISGYVTTAGGSVLRTNSDSPWGRRRLAYPIRHASQDVRDGFYTLFHFELEPARMTEIERDLGLNDRIMRHMVLQLPGMPVFPEPEAEPAEGEAGEAESGGEAATAAADSVDSGETGTEPEAGEAESSTAEVSGEAAAAEGEASEPAGKEEE